MLSVIGLSLDILGVAMLAWGPLAGGAGLVATFGGVHLSAETRARDGAFLVVGMLCVLSGFVMQGLPYLGVSQSGDPSSTRIAAAVTLIVGSLIAAVAIRVLKSTLRGRIEARERPRDQRSEDV
jgi:hypothetical protein